MKNKLTAVSATQTELNAANRNNGVLVQTNWPCAITCNKTSTVYLPDILIQWDVAMHQSQPVAGAIPPPAASVEEDDEDEVVVTED